LLDGKPERKRPFGRSRHSFVDNIRVDLKEIGWEFVDSEDLGVFNREIGWGCVCGLDASGSGYGPMTGYCEHGNETSVFMNGGEFLD
jgi:hypothetical protein